MSHLKAGRYLTAEQVNTIAHQGIRLLEEQVLETSVDQVEFSNIPQGFRNLQVVMSGGTTSLGSQIDGFLNGDTSTNYDHVTYVMRANDIYAAYPLRSFAGVELGFFASSTLMNSSSFYLSGYSRTDRQKLMYGQAVSGLETGDDNGTIFNHMQGWWKSSAAVTDLWLTPRKATQIAAGSLFQLYGLGSEQL